MIDDSTFFRVLRTAKEHGGLVSVHAENGKVIDMLVKDLLDYYLNEFTFRFNRRTCKARGSPFYRLIEQAVDYHPVPCKMITGGQSQHMVYG